MAIQSRGMAKKRRGLTMRQSNILTGYGFLSLWITGFAVFTAYPLIYSIYLSFSNVKVGIKGIETKFSGLHWYKEVLFADVDFYPALVSTLQFIGYSTPIIVVAALIIAVLLNGEFFGRGFFRTIFFFPVIIISGPVISEFMNNNAADVANPSKYAIFNLIASLPDVISQPLTYVIVNIVIILWFSGVQILIYLSGLQKIGRPIYEAAQIDGASKWEIFWKIVLPYIKPLILVNAIYTVVELAAFPNNKINALISSRMFQANVIYSYSAAISWIYFVVQILLLLVCLIVTHSRKDDAV